MKRFWQWILSLFGHKPKGQPTTAPSPTPASGTDAPSEPPVSAPVVPGPVLPSPSPVVPVTPVPPTPAPAPPVEVPPNVPPTPDPVPDPVVSDPVPAPVPPVGPPIQVPAPPAPTPAPVLPSFSDDFAAGKLDTSKWIPSNWNAPGGGTFRPDALDFSQGCLRIRVTQTKNVDGSVSSVGGELQSKQKFGFGTYEWVLRASSVSPLVDEPGKAVSGQISSGFIFQQDNGYTEIDSPEIQGQLPNKISWSSYLTAKQEQNVMTDFANPEAGFHSYKAVWSSIEVKFFIDDKQVASFTGVPQKPAYAMINHWGTNSTGWGGPATPGVDRYMFVKSFSFTPLP